ncbi:MAG: aminotransferase class III-fold pyridoxal phosphate-dependent enzyme [Planctomycetota bacterium]
MGNGRHSSTYGGNPLACAAASVVLDTILGEELVGRSRQMGDLIGERLNAVAAAPVVGDIRGCGSFWGVEFVHGRRAAEPAPAIAAAVRARLVQAGVLTVNGGVHSNMVRLLPALNIDLDLLERALDEFVEAVRSE